jgi:predicted RNase H-like HicB family nuclease
MCMKREFTAIYKKSGKWFLAWIEEIPGVNTQGKTLKEAKENLKDALSLILETNRNLLFGKVSDFKRESISIKVPA